MSLPKAPFQSSIIPLTSKVTAVWQQWFDRLQILVNNLTNSGVTSGRPTKDLWIGQPYFDTTLNAPVYWNGSTWVTSAPSGVTSVTGAAPIASSGGSTPNISISQATSSSNGYLSAADWTTFNNKVTSVTGTAPVVSSGGVNPAISMLAANGSTNGYLTSTDWTTFNSAASKGFVDVAATYGTSTAAIQLALDSNSGRTLYFKSGIWSITSNIFINHPCTILGDSPQTMYNYEYPSGPINTNDIGTVFQASSLYSGDLFTVRTNLSVSFVNVGFQPDTLVDITGIAQEPTYLPASPAIGTKYLVVRDTSDPSVENNIFIYTGSWSRLSNPSRTGGSYIKFSTPSNATTNFGSRISNCMFAFGYYSVFFEDAAGFVVRDSYFANTKYVDIYVANVSLVDYGDSCITNCYMDFWVGWTGGNGYAHVYQVSSGALKLTANKFLAGQYHWYVSPGTNRLNDGFFTGNSCEGAAAACVALIGGTSTEPNPYYPNITTITGNEIAAGDGHGMYLSGANIWLVNIVGNNIGGGQWAILLENSAGSANPYTIAISSNNFGGPNNGIRILDTSSAYIGCNQVNCAGTKFSISGTSNNRYAMGQAQNGGDRSFMTSNTYGSFYKITATPGLADFKRVYFPTAFPQTPNVSINIRFANESENYAGAIGVMLGVITPTYFDWFGYGINNFGYIDINYEAWLTGQ